MMVFASVSEAIRAGFSVYDKTPDGYLVRQLRSDGKWAMALVRIP